MISLLAPPDLISLAAPSSASAALSALHASTPSPTADAESEKARIAALRAVMAQVGEKYRYRLPDATGRKDIEYYRDPAHRGYLAYTVKEGETPSLFFKPQAEVKDKKK